LHPRSHVTFKDEKIMEKLLGINFWIKLNLFFLKMFFIFRIFCCSNDHMELQLHSLFAN
jgi:hypothetical protein